MVKNLVVMPCEQDSNSKPIIIASKGDDVDMQLFQIWRP